MPGRGPVCEWADLSRQSDTVNPEQNNQKNTTTRKGKIENGYVHNGMQIL